MDKAKPVLTPAERRARRELRREKQRGQNVLRAGKMHMARVAAATDKRGEAPVIPAVNIGCSGWFYWHWRGHFYPEGMNTKEWFAQYASTFRTVELNASFYSWPTLANVEGWKTQAGTRRFLYTVKANELITHTKAFKNTKTLIQDFSYIADLLGPRMGCFLFQLPPSFHYTPARLRNLLAQLDHSRRNVVEFRHKSWWREEVYAAFRAHGTIFCACSAPRLPDDMVCTADDVYIRFHGVKRWYRHDYSHEELAAWADKIRASGARRVWAYFNNDFDGYAIKNAKTLRRLLK